MFAATSVISAQTKDLDLGGVVISVSDSRTAQVFHIVDQLSQWDSASHRQYVRWAARNLNLGQEDQKLLQKHAELRRGRGWGHGFEQAFYVDDSIEVAAKRAVENELISAKVPLFLAPNPEEGNAGGGFNGGRLVVEVQEQPDPLPTLFHECLHALLRRHKEAIRVAAESVGLSWGALNEGIAHAFSPGLTDNTQGGDPLAEWLVKSSLASDSSVQKYMVAVVIRPLLRSALDRNETFTSFLPKAVNKLREFNWR